MPKSVYIIGPTARTTGTVALDGADIIGPAVDLRYPRRRVGMVFQEITVFYI